MRRARGAALLLSLAVVLISSVLVVGVATLATQQASTARTRMSAAQALDTAEAALNWELGKVSRSAFDGTAADSAGNPFQGSLANAGAPGVRGASPIQGDATVYVTDGAGSQPWRSPGPLQIQATGTVDGVTRTVSAYATPVGPGDSYTLYGVGSLTLAGRSSISGQIGCAGACRVGGEAELSGTVVFDRSGGTQGGWSGHDPGWDHLNTPITHPFPTVAEVAARALAQLGWSTTDPIGRLKSPAFNDNDAWIGARDADGSVSAIRWSDRNGNSLPHDRLDAHLFDANDPTATGKPLQAIVLTGRPDRLANGFTRGSNFYFEHFQVPAGRTLEIRNNLSVGPQHGFGPVRVWLGPAGRSAVPNRRFDLTRGDILVDDTDETGGESDSNWFALYNSTGDELRVGGLHSASNAAGRDGLFAMLYAVNQDGAGGYGSIRVEGDTRLRGSIVAWSVSHTGGDLDAAMSQRTGVGTDPLAFILYYRVGVLWRETDPPSRIRSL